MHHSRVKSIVACWILLVPAASAASDYGPMTLFQLLTTNEIAVRGEVRNVEDARYDLDLAHNFRPSQLQRTLGVIRIDTYPPGTRSGEFAEGQSVALFAVPASDGLVRPLGKAGEGELPRDAKYVYVRALSRPPATVVRTKDPSGTYTAYRIESKIFDVAVEGFYACYQPIAARKIKQICSNDAQNRYQRSSWLAEHLSGIAERLISKGD